MFGSDMAVKVHHSRVHGESIAGVEVSCSYCGESKHVKKVHAEEQDQFFCDAQCQGDWRAEHRSGKDNPLWEGKVVDCAYCADPIEISGWRYEDERDYFCDQGCMGQWRSENLLRENNPQWSRVEVECAHCEAQFHREKAQVNDSTNFCDRLCYGKWLSENIVGTDHPNWNGGDANYGPGWNESKKEQVRERDGRECQNCGRSEEEHLELIGRKHHVHHIQKARSFDDPAPRNDPDNLITLCHTSECHWKWEKMSPLRPQVE